MRITRNYMNALMAANKSPASKRRMSGNSFASAVNNRYNTQANKLGSTTQAIYQNMKNNAGELQATSSKLKDTGEDSIYAKAEESGDTSQITKLVKDFVNQYNGTVRSLKSSNSRVDNSYLNQLNSYATMHRNTLQASGITKNADGTLSVNDKVLQNASVEQLRQTFGSSSSFGARAGETAVNVQYNAVSGMNSIINSTYSNLLKGFGLSGGFFNFWS
ncbi:MAG: hypothetical protein J1E98_11745 [Lachnospiraceae bacterium]|nr:hypothetical protein [Lachnospiraceae bacterium]